VSKAISKYKHLFRTTSTNGFYTVSRLPPGWPQLAEQEDFYRNRGLRRRFGRDTERVIQFTEGNIHLLSKRISEIDKQDEENRNNRLKGIVKQYKEEQNDDGSHDPDELYALLYTLRSEIIIQRGQNFSVTFRFLHPVSNRSLDKLTFGHRQMKMLPKVSRHQIKKHYNMLKQYDLLEDEAIEVYSFVDDFVTTHTYQGYQFLETIIYCGIQSRFGVRNFLLSVLVNNFCREHIPGRIVNISPLNLNNSV
jgi:hypothetical protein